jgi:hypothetical protein
MPEEPLKVTWTSTLGTAAEKRFIDKIIRYGDIYYLSYPINSPGEITRRPPSFSYASVERRILRDSSTYRKQLATLTPIMESEQVRAIPVERQNDIDPYLNNGYFSATDGKLGYAILADLKPRMVLEIGAGNSTKFFRKSISDFKLETRLVAVDPAPRADLTKVADEIITSSVIDLDLGAFNRLAPGDILSWDGSHLVTNGSDVTRLFLEVLPMLKPGVVVHVHDIMMPYEAYDPGVAGLASVSYPEQYMLGNYLLWAEGARILLPVHYLFRMNIVARNGFSFWFVTG